MTARFGTTRVRLAIAYSGDTDVAGPPAMPVLMPARLAPVTSILRSRARPQPAAPRTIRNNSGKMRAISTARLSEGDIDGCIVAAVVSVGHVTMDLDRVTGLQQFL